MNKEFTLSFIFITLFTNNIYAYNANNDCENLLKNGENKKAVVAAKRVKNQYDSYFCSAKANYRMKNYAAAINEFDESTKHADLPVDQLFSYLYMGITQRDNGDINTSTSTFTKGLNTAALGNSKYMQMERRFLYQLGQNALALDKGSDAVDFFSKSLVISANDDERGESFEGLSLAYFVSNKLDSAIEYGVKASTTFQRTGKLNEYAEMQIKLSNYESAQENYIRALRILTSLENFAKKNGGQYFQAKALLEKSLILNKQGHDEEATGAFKQGQAIAIEIGANDLLPPKD
ncbi:MAG: tetratricopeptide repeat protein [Methylophilaceae bacterium]